MHDLYLGLFLFDREVPERLCVRENELTLDTWSLLAASWEDFNKLYEVISISDQDLYQVECSIAVQ